MTNALAMANAANTAISQTPRNLPVQSALDFLFNNGDATIAPDFGQRELSLQYSEYLGYRENFNDIFFGRCLWPAGITRLTTQGHFQCSIRSR